MPMLARRCRRLPSSTTGAASTSNRRSTSDLARSAPGARIANSSPPRRATVSSARSAWRRRSPQIFSSSVAGGVAERVVDLLEVVEVEEGDDGGLAAGQRLGDALLEQRAVREPGQRVLEREPAQVAVALAAAAGAVEQREQRGQADHHQRHHDDRADPGHPVAAVGELRGCGRRRRAARGGCCRSRRWRSIGGGALEVARAHQRELLLDQRLVAREQAQDGSSRPRCRGARGPRARRACRRSSERELGLDAAAGRGARRWPRTPARRRGWRSTRARPGSRSGCGARRRAGAGQRCRRSPRSRRARRRFAIMKVRLPCILPGWSARRARS